MKQLLDKVGIVLSQKGYKKKGKSFWKIKNGFYRLVDFQRGAYGDYYFINLCLHPVDFPRIEKNEIRIFAHPKEYECIIRERAEYAVDNPRLDSFKNGFVSTDDENMISNVCNSVDDFEMWFDEWGNFEKIADSSFDEMTRMLTAVPLLWKKYYLALRCYCAFKAGLEEKCEELFDECVNESSDDMDFNIMDEYLSNVIRNRQ